MEPQEKYGTDVEKWEERGLIETKNIPPVVDPQANFFAAVERLAINPDVDVAKIKQIMEMQEHVLDRNAEQAFNAAMTKVQNKIELVVAKTNNNQTHSKYANLTDILLSAKPIYTAEGFSLMFYEGESKKENHTRVCVDIMHRQGHTKQRYGEFAVQTTGIAGKAMMTLIHGEGSAIAYGRRYLTCMIFNVPTGDDDDGNAAGNIKYLSNKQLSSLTDMINAKEADEIKFLKYLKIESLEKIPARDFNKAMSALKAKPNPERVPGQEG